MSEISPGILANVRIVLMNTTHPGNIGAVARAMKNMGLTQLTLVAPKLYPHEDAARRSASALDVLDNARVVEDLDDALSDCGLIIGTSARERTVPWPLVGPRDCAEQVLSEAGSHTVAIVFGREDRGLTNDELRKCHLHLHIPTSDDYSSLNLAAAVQIVCYELRMAVLNQNPEVQTKLREWDMPAASAADMSHFYEHMEEVLGKLGFLQPKNPRLTMTRLQRLYNRARLDRMEIAMLRGILKAMDDELEK